MMKVNFLPKAVLLFMFLSSHLLADTGMISGKFEIVTIRNASDVANMIQRTTPLNDGDSPIGKTIEFNSKGIIMQGLGCDTWTVSKNDAPLININDPLLMDLTVKPTDSPLSSGEQRVSLNFSYACEGEQFLQVFKLDDRVIVIPWNNSSQYLIAEIPLTPDQIKTFQTQLKSMKFYHHNITGELDPLTIESVNAWLKYRLKKDGNYSFFRPAITENLLDALGVLNRIDKE